MAALIHRLAHGQGRLPALALLGLLLVILVLMGRATTNSAQFGRMYSGLLLLSAVGLGALAALILYNLAVLIRLYRRRVPGARLTLRLAGIFAVRVHGVGDGAWPGVASLGVRPTINGGGEPLLEAHLFDFDGDLYGRRIAVEFVRKLRDEVKFDGLDAMVRQIGQDATEARAILVDSS